MEIVEATGLSNLTNEILIEITSFLSIGDLRQLGRSNTRLHLFVADYLIRFRYNNSAILTLPNEIVFEILGYLSCQKDRSHLGQASHRFYPLAMSIICRHNVRHNQSSLLNYASKRNLTRMVRNVLHLGGDVNTQCQFTQDDNRYPLVTPLAASAAKGHRRLVRILLDAGASHFVSEARVPLAAAICNGHESVALLLSQGLTGSYIPLRKPHGTVLQMTSGAKLVNLLQHFLLVDAQIDASTNAEALNNLSTALIRVLLKDVSAESLIKRKLDDDAYQIVLLLLQHGASPDLRIRYGSTSLSLTARDISARHTDPRIRNLLAKTKLEDTTRITSPHGTGGRPLTSMLEPSRWDTPGRQLLYLIQSLKNSKLCWGEKDGTSRGLIGHMYLTLNSWDIAGSVKHGLKHSMVRKAQEALECFHGSSFPQLGNSNPRVQTDSGQFWANLDVDIFRGTKTRNHEGASSASRKENIDTSAVKDPFPKLSNVKPSSNNSAESFWATFAKNTTSNDNLHVEQQSDSKVSTDQNCKRANKKKWRPLLI